MEQSVQQPDFGLVAANLTEVAHHLGRCAHLPAVDGGARLSDRMELMTEQLAALRQLVQQGFADMGRRMEALDRKVTVSNMNFTARMQNGIVVHENVPLAPLHSVVTGDLIRDFPATLEQLDALSARQVDSLLAELGETVRGRPDDRKRQLESALGVRTRAVRPGRRA